MAGYTLSRHGAGRVRDLIGAHDSRITDHPRRRNGAKYFTATVLPARTGANSIAPATKLGTTTTYTSGIVTLERDTGTTLEADGEEVTAYNRLTSTIPANTSVTLAWWGGKLWVIGYEC